MAGSTFDDIFGDEPENDIETETPVEVEAPEVEEAPEQPEPKSEPAPAEKDTNPDKIPVVALLNERDRRQEAERKAAELERKLQELQQKPADDPFAADPYFAEYTQRMQTQYERQRWADRLEDSNDRAIEQYGQEDVEKAADWVKARVDADPTFKAEFLSSRHPMRFAVEQHRKDQKISEVLSDEEAFVRRRAAEMGFVLPETAPADETRVEPAQTNPASAAPRRSIASQASARGASSKPSGSVFDDLF